MHHAVVLVLVLMLLSEWRLLLPVRRRQHFVVRSDRCSGLVTAPGCEKDECCKSAGIGSHCFCDTCD